MAARSSAPSLIRCLARPHASSPMLPAACCIHPHQQRRTLRTKPVNPTTPQVDKHGKKVVTRTIESMPFQAYQLALEVIREDRAEIQQQIRRTSDRLTKALAVPDVDPKARHILSLKRHLHKLRIEIDMNNPRVKYNFDNGIIGTNKPVYRLLLERKWRALPRPTLMQRLNQMHVIPDIIPYIEPVVDVQIRFQGREVKPGTILSTLRTERPPTVKIVPFKDEQNNMLCTIAVVDPDVPEVEKDRFKYRLHWLVCNIPIAYTQNQAITYPAAKDKSAEIVPYLPPHVQKGIPYHRYGLFVLQQSAPIDPEVAKQALTARDGSLKRDNFKLRSFQAKNNLTPIGATLWRNEFDEGTKEVMERHGLEGADIMWQRVKG